jgi:hypothetical protein
VEKRNTYRVLVGKPEGNKPIRRSEYRRRIILKWILEK